MNEEFMERARPLPQNTVSPEFEELLDRLSAIHRPEVDDVSRSLLSTLTRSQASRGGAEPGGEYGASSSSNVTALSSRRRGRALLWLGGVDPDVVRHLPMLRLRYQAIGTAVLVSGLISGASLWYSLTYLLNLRPVIGVTVGIILALFDVALTRLLLVAEANQRSFGMRLLHALPRVLIAFAIAFGVSTPLLMQVFAAEVDSALNQSRAARIAAFSATQQRDPKLIQLETSILETQKAISSNIDCAFRQFGNSSPNSVDPKCDTKPGASTGEAGFATTQKALLDFTQQISDMRIQHQAELARYTAQVNRPPGLLERIDALTSFRTNSSTARNIFFALLCVIALLESLPVIIGLLSPRTAYDLLLYAEERVATLRGEAEIAARTKISERLLRPDSDSIDIQSIDTVVRSAVDSSVQAVRSEIRSEIVDFAAERERRRAA
ncbi:hypothetical protein Pth03_82260 [Planotetraspora thailandica]|uniref:DUF4407 domain-containing protein n=1 Tax=Planotetraspora thailandica TaxID=487172 RepID=A0A8J4DGS1_9ACTN|nr:DUF4407 domain-containing protein [Planotetraspora thailandica]GII59837.1 hypothetical protein Pth03_82260 [Planotetraspora thailandica]